METDRRDNRCEGLWRLLRRIWRFLCNCGSDDSGIKLSVEETTPSSVRQWRDDNEEDEV